VDARAEGMPCRRRRARSRSYPDPREGRSLILPRAALPYLANVV